MSAFWRGARRGLWNIDKALGYAIFGKWHTVSYHAARSRERGGTWGCVLCRLLDALDKNHCAKSLKDD